MLLALPFCIVLAWVLLALTSLREARAMPRLVGRLPRLLEEPQVLVIIPARNEAEVVERCLRSVLAQQGVQLQVALYDDRSVDDTARRAEDIAHASEGRLRVFRGDAEPPPGWCGKPHALDSALRAAGFDVDRGRYADGSAPPHFIAFVDADVVLRPTALAELSALMLERSAGLGSALPLLVCRSFWERTVGPSMGALVTARHRPSQVNDPSNPAALANGQLLMVTPQAYAYVGGHACVRDQVLEDVLLAAKLKASGHRIVLADGQAVLSTRMYASFSELWEGWSKNAYPLVGGTPGRALGYAMLALWVSFTPLLCLGWALGMAVEGDPRWPWMLAGWLVPLLLQARLRKLGGQPPGYALFAPLAAAVVALLLVRATARARRGRPVAWKGRSYLDGKGVQPGA